MTRGRTRGSGPGCAALAPIGAGDLVLGADINWISDHNDGAYTTDDNARLADNLC